MGEVRVRAASEDDVSLILSFIKELAEYERLSHEVVATEKALRRWLFGERPVAEVLIGPVLPQLLDLSRETRHLPRGPVREARVSRQGGRPCLARPPREVSEGALLRAAGVVGAELERAGHWLLQRYRWLPGGRLDGLPCEWGGARRAGRALTERRPHHYARPRKIRKCPRRPAPWPSPASRPGQPGLERTRKRRCRPRW
jgi:hypothetical protein